MSLDCKSKSWIAVDEFMMSVDESAQVGGCLWDGKSSSYSLRVLLLATRQLQVHNVKANKCYVSLWILTVSRSRQGDNGVVIQVDGVRLLKGSMMCHSPARVPLRIQL